MARIRTIKPEFFTSGDVVELSPLARLFFIALWCESDREGRIKWKPKTLKMRYLPSDDCNIEDLSKELISTGMLKIYQVKDDNNFYAFIPSFTNHQVVNNRETASILPNPADALKTRESAVKAEGRKEGKEGTGFSIDILEEEFSTFWKTYPSKRNNPKKPAKDKFISKRKAGYSFEDILEGAKNYSSYCKQEKTEEKFIAQTVTWLNQERWSDELKLEPKRKGRML